MKKSIFTTFPNDTGLLILRLAIAVVIFPHGAQKVLGWFNGPGFTNAMGFFSSMNIPSVLGGTAIITEFAAPILLLFGFLTRIAALGIAIDMAVAALMVHFNNGFFMNWFGNQKGEGFEYHLLAIGICVALIIRGGGAASMDATIMKHNTTT